MYQDQDDQNIEKRISVLEKKIKYCGDSDGVKNYFLIFFCLFISLVCLFFTPGKRDWKEYQELKETVKTLKEATIIPSDSIVKDSIETPEYVLCYSSLLTGDSICGK